MPMTKRITADSYAAHSQGLNYSSGQKKRRKEIVKEERAVRYAERERQNTYATRSSSSSAREHANQDVLAAMKERTYSKDPKEHLTEEVTRNFTYASQSMRDGDSYSAIQALGSATDRLRLGDIPDPERKKLSDALDNRIQRLARVEMNRGGEVGPREARELTNLLINNERYRESYGISNHSSANTVVGIIGMSGLLSGLAISTANITGNVIGTPGTSGSLGAVLVIIGILGLGLFVKNR